MSEELLNPTDAALLIGQREVIRFLFLLGKTPTECLTMLQQAYGSKSMKRAAVFRWHAAFFQGRVDSAPRPKTGRPVSVCTEVFRNSLTALLAEDNSLSQREMAVRLGVAKSTIQLCLASEFQMQRICMRWVVISKTVYQYRIIVGGGSKVCSSF